MFEGSPVVVQCVCPGLGLGNPAPTNLEIFGRGPGTFDLESHAFSGVSALGLLSPLLLIQKGAPCEAFLEMFPGDVLAPEKGALL